MAYSEANPPRLVMQNLGNTDMAKWTYQSADAATVVRGANYITNALRLGMKVGDIVEVWDNDSSPPAITIMTVVTVAAAGADLSDGTAITATNT